MKVERYKFVEMMISLDIKNLDDYIRIQYFYFLNMKMDEDL